MTIIQYIIVRKDLMKAFKWNIGALIANCCHAVSSINELTKNDDVTKEYLSPENIDKMHKCVLTVENEDGLVNLSTKLESAGIIHKMWIEMPENFPSCIAVKPYEKEDIQSHFKDYKLFR